LISLIEKWFYKEIFFKEKNVTKKLSKDLNKTIEAKVVDINNSSSSLKKKKKRTPSL